MNKDKLITDINNLASKLDENYDELTMWQVDGLTICLDKMFRILREKKERRK